MEPNCIQCGATFYGRTDKKFCDDQCRSAYHNHKNSQFTNMMRMTHRKLRRNWKILTSQVRSGQMVINHHVLFEQGFAPHLMTGIEMKGEKVLYRCYEHTYEINEDGFVYITHQADQNMTDE